MLSKAMFAQIPSQSLLAPHQKHYPYRDCHSQPLPPDLAVPEHDALILHFFQAAPQWANRLMALRNSVVRLFGLKTGTNSSAPALLHPPFRPGQALGIFRILELAPHEVILGEEDRHLDFRVSLLIHQHKLHVSTLVRPHNLFGIAYLLAILPFHHLIAGSMTRRMAQRITSP